MQFKFKFNNYATFNDVFCPFNVYSNNSIIFSSTYKWWPIKERRVKNSWWRSSWYIFISSPRWTSYYEQLCCRCFRIQVELRGYFTIQTFLNNILIQLLNLQLLIYLLPDNLIFVDHRYLPAKIKLAHLAIPTKRQPLK